MLTLPHRPDPNPGPKPLKAWIPGLLSTGTKCCDHLAWQLLLDWLVQVSLWPRSGSAVQFGLPGVGLILAGSCRSESYLPSGRHLSKSRQVSASTHNLLVLPRSPGH